MGLYMCSLYTLVWYSWDRKNTHTKALSITSLIAASQTAQTLGQILTILHTPHLQQENKVSFNFCPYMWTIYFILRAPNRHSSQKFVYLPILKLSLISTSQVHHIDPKGEDSGVVYSEMQGRENTSGDLMSLRSVIITISWLNCYRRPWIACSGCWIPQEVPIEVRLAG